MVKLKNNGMIDYYRLIFFTVAMFFLTTGCIAMNEETRLTGDIVAIKQKDMHDDFKDHSTSYDSITLHIIEPHGFNTIKVFFESSGNNNFFIGARVSFSLTEEDIKSCAEGNILFEGSLNNFHVIK